MDRIEYKGPNMHYVEMRISAILDQMHVQSEQAQTEQKTHVPGNGGRLFSFGYRHKDRIRRIPIIGATATRVAKRLQERDFVNMVLKPKLELLWHLPPDDFIISIYQALLHHPPHEQGFQTCRSLLVDGMPRQAMVYMLASYGGNTRLGKQFTEYKKSHKKWKRRSMLKKIKILVWINNTLRFPGRVRHMYMQFNELKLFFDKLTELQQMQIDLQQKFEQRLAALEHSHEVLRGELQKPREQEKTELWKT